MASISTGRRVVMAAVIAATLAAASWAVRRDGPAYIALYSDAVALDGKGERTLVSPGSAPAWVNGTRVIERNGIPTSLTLNAARAQQAWVAPGSVPGAAGPYADMARDALLDLRTLTVEGAPVAAWSPYWRYVWPRDASFVAVAYARTNRVADARRVLDFLQRVQAPDGSFHARYLPDGSGPPDDRGIQEDGPGWALWALREVVQVEPSAAPVYATLRDRSAARLLARAGLAAPSSDYWEVRETRLTLGVIAPTLAGLDAAAALYEYAGDYDRAREVKAGADRTAHAIETSFGPTYPRHLGGDKVDAAVTFLLPPFQTRSVRGAAEAVRAAEPRLRRPAGGLAPGEGWKDDGISWTPETALFALAAAATDDAATARRWLDWIDAHRTPQGAIPEKVLHDGRPAAVAPLAWTSALVLITLTELD